MDPLALNLKPINTRLFYYLEEAFGDFFLGQFLVEKHETLNFSSFDRVLNKLEERTSSSNLGRAASPLPSFVIFIV